MNFLPFVGFYYRQRVAIEKIMGTEHRGLKLLINLVHANLPIIKKELPGHDDLLDDFQKTLDEASYGVLTEGVENARN
jgi:hypothetical protein